MKKPDQTKKRTEKEKKQAYDYIESEIFDIRDGLKSMYQMEKGGWEGYIHGLVEKIDTLKFFMFGFLLDEEPIKILLLEASKKKTYYYKNSHT